LQAIALVSCFVSFGGVSLASENHTGANRKIAIVISRWAEWGLFFIIALLMASVLMNGSWAAINYFLK
jgi:hypothetical protein